MTAHLRWHDYPARDGESARHELRRGSRTLVTVMECSPGCWFWFGLEVSTRHRPTDLPSAKAEARSHVRVALAAADRAAARSKEQKA
jgi:hypothetical protein